MKIFLSLSQSSHCARTRISALHVTLCHFMSLHVTSCHFMSLHVNLCHFMSLPHVRFALCKDTNVCISCHFMSLHGPSRQFMSLHVILSHSLTSCLYPVSGSHRARTRISALHVAFRWLRDRLPGGRGFRLYQSRRSRFETRWRRNNRFDRCSA
jgi:hypothetical protein